MKKTLKIATFATLATTLASAASAASVTAIVEFHDDEGSGFFYNLMAMFGFA